MAKKRIINRGKKTIRNAHLIGKGGKQLRPINGSYVKSYNKTFGKAKSKVQTKAHVTKTPLKSNAGLIRKKAASRIKTSKAPSVRHKGLKKMKRKIAKPAPKPKITMKSKAPVKRNPPPPKGKGR